MPKLATLAPFELTLATVLRCAENSNTWTFLMPGEPLPKPLAPTNRGSYAIRTHLN
jgi:hypothetical protein